MTRRSKGAEILSKGLLWRKQLANGSTLLSIATQESVNSQVVSRAVWLAQIPKYLIKLICEHPEIFTRSILLNGFASKRKLFQKDAYRFLNLEVKRMIKKGPGSRPNLNMERNTPIKHKEKVSTNPVLNISEALHAEAKIKAALGYKCRVAFDLHNACEVTILLKDKDELSDFIDGLMKKMPTIKKF